MANANVGIQIGAKDRATQVLKGLGGAFSKTFSGIRTAAGKVGGALKGIGGAMTSLKGLVGAFVAFKGVTALVGWMKEGIALAQVQAQAVGDLTRAMGRAGVEGAQAASKDFQAFASSLQAVTTTGDEAILEAATLGTRFGIVGEDLKKATKAALDMSASLGTSVKSSMILLGKAAKGETGTLGKFGIKLKDGIAESEKFGAALDAITETFGGAAQDAAKTYAGRMQQVSNSYGDLRENVGLAVTQNKIFNAFLVETRKTIDQLGGGIADNQQAMTDWVTKGVEMGFDALQSVIKIGGFVIKMFLGLKTVVLGLGAVFAGTFGLMVKAVQAMLSPINLMIQGLNALPGVEVYNPIEEGLNAVAGAAFDAAGEMAKLAGESAQSMVNVDGAIEAAGKTMSDFKNRVLETAKTIETDLTPAVQTTTKAIADQAVVKAEAEEKSKIIDFDAQLRQQQSAVVYDENKAAFEKMQEEAQAVTDLQIANTMTMANSMAQATGAAFESMVSGQATVRQAFGQLAKDVIGAAAAKAAAEAASAVAGIPVVGPFLAPAAAAGMLGLVKGFLSLVKFADGGVVTGGSPGKDSVGALLTPGERVLTVEQNKSFTTLMRRGPRSGTAAASSMGMASGGEVSAGGRGGINLTFAPRIESLDLPTQDQRKRALLRLGKDLEELVDDGLLLRNLVGA